VETCHKAHYSPIDPCPLLELAACPYLPAAKFSSSCRAMYGLCDGEQRLASTHAPVARRRTRYGQRPARAYPAVQGLALVAGDLGHVVVQLARDGYRATQGPRNTKLVAPSTPWWNGLRKCSAAPSTKTQTTKSGEAPGGHGVATLWRARQRLISAGPRRRSALPSISARSTQSSVRAGRQSEARRTNCGIQRRVSLLPWARGYQGGAADAELQVVTLDQYGHLWRSAGRCG
jgi:hypothetical protein